MSSIIKISIWLTLSELFFNISGYITQAIVGRSLGPAEYGRYSLTITIATMIVVLIGRGVPVAMSKYLSEIYKTNPQEIKHIKKISAEIQIILIAFVTVIYYLLAPVFAYFLNDQTLVPLFKLSSLIIPAFAGASFYVYYFTGIHQFNIQSILKFFRGFSKIILIVLFTLLLKTKGAIIGHTLAPLSVFLLAFFLDKQKKGEITSNNKSIIKKSSSTFKKLTHKTLLSFAWPITLFMIFYEIMITIDLYMVKALLQNDTLTGFYNASLTIGRLPFYAFYFLTIILLPKISESTANNQTKQTRKIIQKAMRFLFMFSIPAITLLFVFSPSIIHLFYGKSYLPATPVLQILTIGLGFLTIFYILAFILNGAGKNRIPMLTALGGMLLNIFLNYYLISRLGLKGGAIATTITSFLIMIIAIITTEKYIASFLQFTAIFKYLITTIIIGCIASFLPQGKFIFIFWSIILLLIYFVLLWLLREISNKDFNILKTIFKKDER